MYRLVRTSGDSHVWEQTPASVPAWRRSSLHLDSTIEIALYETGPADPEAPAIVLVHGLGHWTQASWNRVAVRLEATHRIVAFDLPGFGRSSRPDTRYDIRFFSAALSAVVNAASLRSFALAGHSLGGLIAADFASMHIDDVDLLMLIDPAGFLRTPSLLARILASGPVSNLFTIKPSRGFVRAQLERSVYDKRALEPGVVDEAYAFAQDPLMRRAFARVYSDSLSSFVDLPALHARFSRYKGPASIFWGLNDKYIPVRALAGARKVYPNADVTVIEHCGHCPPIEFPDLVAQRLAAYGANRTGASVDGRSYR
jgi:4,5:9,10-diseco-3-hydroxy-5,9,17-trioxoandrosta-1(10),2-diene-4-oate hydrolase